MELALTIFAIVVAVIPLALATAKLVETCLNIRQKWPKKSQPAETVLPD